VLLVVSMLRVAPAWRRRGIGGGILRALLAHQRLLLRLDLKGEVLSDLQVVAAQLALRELPLLLLELRDLQSLLL
jgi:GNAT superfamily N-acetyltransferase